VLVLIGIENDRTGELYGGAETCEELCRRGGRRFGGGVESFISVTLYTIHIVIDERGAYMLMKTS
jgi:hypothetical protein